MNERIKELAEQAESSRLEYNSYTMMNNRIQEFDKEKFAELIIQECGIALSPMLRDMVSRGQAYDLIKKHFGVE
jgi:predicted TPR repeat methyltransferase